MMGAGSPSPEYYEPRDLIDDDTDDAPEPDPWDAFWNDIDALADEIESVFESIARLARDAR